MTPLSLARLALRGGTHFCLHPTPAPLRLLAIVRHPAPTIYFGARPVQAHAHTTIIPYRSNTAAVRTYQIVVLLGATGDLGQRCS